MLVFVDESGYAQPRDPSPWWTLTAVCVPETSSRDLSRRLFAKVGSVYPKADASSFEIKAAELLNRRQYETSPQRQALVAEVTQLLETLPVAVFSVCGKRPAAAPNWPKHQVDPAHRILVERVELYMRERKGPGLAKLVFDEVTLSNDALVSRSLRRFFHATDEGRCCGNVLDVPFFVSSAITPGIQLADVMAGAIRHYRILKDAGSPFRTDWEKAIERLDKVARLTTRNFTVGTETYYGLYIMPDRYYANPPGLRAF